MRKMAHGWRVVAALGDLRVCSAAEICCTAQLAMPALHCLAGGWLYLVLALLFNACVMR
jgi:hypothetical protein